MRAERKGAKPTPDALRLLDRLDRLARDFRRGVPPGADAELLRCRAAQACEVGDLLDLAAGETASPAAA